MEIIRPIYNNDTKLFSYTYFVINSLISICCYQIKIDRNGNMQISVSEKYEYNLKYITIKP